MYVGGECQAFFSKFQMNLDLSKSCFGPGNKLRWTILKLKGYRSYSGSGDPGCEANQTVPWS